MTKVGWLAAGFLLITSSVELSMIKKGQMDFFQLMGSKGLLP
jgi:hypothetical protein